MSNSFKQFRVTWQQKPYAYNPKRVVFVRAKSSEDAQILAKNHIEQQGLEKSEFSVMSVSDVDPLPAGEIL
jgi:hypothetical protein